MSNRARTCVRSTAEFRPVTELREYPLAYEVRLAWRSRVGTLSRHAVPLQHGWRPMEKLYLVLLGIACLITVAWILFLLYGGYYLLGAIN